jgi:hypothetical protein
MNKSALCCAVLLIGVAAMNCGTDARLVNNPNSPTVKLRDELMELAKGNIDKITGTTKEGEGYVLRYGYEADMEIRSLPISATLCDKLDKIRPPEDTEIYVLAHYQGDEILEYTRWRNAVDFPYHPNYETPQLITGNPYAYKVDAKRNLIKLN